MGTGMGAESVDQYGSSFGYAQVWETENGRTRMASAVFGEPNP